MRALRLTGLARMGVESGKAHASGKATKAEEAESEGWAALAGARIPGFPRTPVLQ